MQDGIIIIDKELNFSSNKIIQQLKRKLKLKKIGHAGTLDPLASGVLIALIGNGTKISDFLLNEDKTYQVTIKLFETTSTLDAEGEIIETQTPFAISLEQVQAAIKHFTNLTYDQIPPIYSAIKVDGKKLYEYALQNQDVEIKPRTITINSIELIEFENDKIKMIVNASKGTYIRSFALDFAKQLNTIGFVTELRRLASGGFDLSRAKQVNEITEQDIIPLREVIEIAQQPILKFENTLVFEQGKKVKLDLEIPHPIVFIENHQKQLVAIYEIDQFPIYKSKRGGLNN
ncbi:tRNA pseudouridine synthase B [Williamsoniiplasma luminosum]|uniref:tRNA pseudouridine synthase B n=1 Tax=Williamsoniiplasma luminosum TaxID=214888 RepID=A0A2K8NUI0_9MOLU|nr:tRNA pseudouridine(55) synthase TruB [Williamsoniiplasma luminosum]ATZ17196.1 tRNA pseudouridine synthase B [Williamsoniiplasma luminosum]